MSIFSDDDLKRLKEMVYRTPKEDWVHPHRQPEYYKALLARLEAAERCLDGNTHRPLLDPQHYGACVCEDHRAWRKSKGE